MTIYSFWIFDRHCNCVYAKDWQRQRAARRPNSYIGSSATGGLGSPLATKASLDSSASAAAAASGAGGSSSSSLQSFVPGDFVYRRAPPPLQVDANVLQPSVAVVPRGQKNNGPSAIAATALHHPLFDSELGKLVFGVVFSLRNMARKLTDDADGFTTFSTSKYKVHFYETPSNVRFVLVSDPGLESQGAVLRHIYGSMYVEYASKNPLYPVDPVSSAVLANDLLVLDIESYIASLPGFE
ncbi:uncharacterized protein SAPINGB_P002203 [Magnusiomyces paraingens]|uniref:Trafficking protein particle complex subunit n=1 Tax=Magnusiomyces paraingens TaxID=2606893 RepID=A0A5E8BEX7_9ASCO|nr:uncharacterized protein SAPINGB_P002203 [Saprochaete ingens]VVT49302.1 unnamed protein product [Saprochaete ingens]